MDSLWGVCTPWLLDPSCTQGRAVGNVAAFFLYTGLWRRPSLLRALLLFLRCLLAAHGSLWGVCTPWLLDPKCTQGVGNVAAFFLCTGLWRRPSLLRAIFLLRCLLAASHSTKLQYRRHRNSR